MNTHPILFSAPMVRALLNGSKTQTRRVVKQQPMMVTDHKIAAWDGPEKALQQQLERLGKGCPYGGSGDQLWVRETFFAWGRWETRFSAKKGRDEWHFVDMTLEYGKAYIYDADDEGPMFEREKRNAGILPGWWKRPAIFMPRAASRITLEVTGVRVERLQDISEADAAAEGVESCDGLLDVAEICRFAKAMGCSPEDCRPWYAALWESINGPGSWEANPWVWVVEFKRVQP